MPPVLSHVLGAVVLGGAFAGYLTTLYRRRWVDVAFLPATICAGSALAVFAGGLLGGLALTATGLVLLGNLALGYALLRHRKAIRAALLEPAVLTFILFCAALAVALRGRRFVQYDNFSHWAVIVKVLLGTDEFPDQGDAVIGFRSYPPGSASFLYAVCRFLGSGEDRVMFAQATMLAAAAVAVHAVALRRRWCGPLLALGAMVILATTGIALDGVQVDTLLAAYLFVPLVLAARHAADLRRTWPVATVVVGFLPTIKASGSLLAAIAVVTIVAVSLARRGRLRWRVLPVVLAPALVAYSWNRHVVTTFPDGAGRYAMPRDPAQIPVKTPAQRREIIDAFARFLATETQLWLTLALAAVILLALVAVGALRRRSAVLVAVGGALAVLAWVLAVLTVYLTAMPYREASHLASARRYIGTAVTLVLLLVLTAAGALFDRAHGWLLLPAAAAALALTLPFLPAAAYLVQPQQLAGTPRGQADIALARSGRLAPGRVCVIEDRRDSGYRRFLLRYLLARASVVERYVTTERHPPDALDGCRYAVLLEPNPLAEELLRRAAFSVPSPPPVVATRQ
ncbi:MAG: hypothetical protein V9G19_19110 [Tetrasphaera sp.]